MPRVSTRPISYGVSEAREKGTVMMTRAGSEKSGWRPLLIAVNVSLSHSFPLRESAPSKFDGPTGTTPEREPCRDVGFEAVERRGGGGRFARWDPAAAAGPSFGWAASVRPMFRSARSTSSGGR